LLISAQCFGHNVQTRSGQLALDSFKLIAFLNIEPQRQQQRLQILRSPSPATSALMLAHLCGTRFSTLLPLT
jgi:hypothetical protein